MPIGEVKIINKDLKIVNENFQNLNSGNNKSVKNDGNFNLLDDIFQNEKKASLENTQIVSKNNIVFKFNYFIYK